MGDRAWRSRLIRGAAAMAALAIALGAPSEVAAQIAVPSAEVVRPGELVRLRTAQWEYTGILARVTGDTAVLLVAADSVRVPRHAVVRVQVQRGSRPSGGRVMAFAAGGAAAGLLAGAFLGATVADAPLAPIGGAVLGVSVGAVAGGIVGAMRRSPGWVGAVLTP